MISCPSCKQKELAGALFCSKCGAQMIYSIEDYSTNVIETETIGNYNGFEVPAFPPPPTDAGECKVALHVLLDGEIIYVQGRNEFSIGRSTKGQTIIPDIDLSAYQAYESGVSRLHANINIQSTKVTINDLGSANGTSLNGDRVNPHDENLVNHGDILTFGHLKVQILIKE
jgi:hypothetical protein